MIQNQATDTTAVKQQQLQKISRFMDNSIRLPGGYRIGWDGVIGLVPGIGDVVGMGISLYIVIGAIRLGASRATVVRMLGNIGVETAIGAVPVIGDVFDLAFKANSRNMKILQSQRSDPVATGQKSNAGLIVAMLIIAGSFLLVSWVVLSLVVRLFTWIF